MNNPYEFQPFEKIARLKRTVVITEKIDGTNAQIMITFDEPTDEMQPYLISSFQDIGRGVDEIGVMYMMAGSRKRWIAPEGTEGLAKGCDNFGFARWAQDNAFELFALGEGRHYGEWYGKGIQRGYDLDEKRFMLFNVARWGEHNPNTPRCCEVATQVTMEEGELCTNADDALDMLDMYGSQHVSERMLEGGVSRMQCFNNPEGVVVYHTASRTLYKQTFENDEGKWEGAVSVKLTDEEVSRWRKNGAFLDKPETAEEHAREVLPAAVEGSFTREEIQDAVEAPMKQGMAEYGA